MTFIVVDRGYFFKSFLGGFSHFPSSHCPVVVEDESQAGEEGQTDTCDISFLCNVMSYE